MFLSCQNPRDGGIDTYRVTGVCTGHTTIQNGTLGLSQYGQGTSTDITPNSNAYRTVPYRGLLPGTGCSGPHIKQYQAASDNSLRREHKRWGCHWGGKPAGTE
ncbi:predicted protein [Histoplasma capsulatum G186AR]|uniref:Uncharacterized protein n=1 Tax=Ajellomyces capsulatus (strain G186AR / H82 / ATCC MYA-2454 / RMSCC 2432) TaxID=447093 RepID=C0NXY5_AJECG|nr:uncharacterized protein HCBG_07779 [Histoplasma capsulatum G186AR]EEH03653.1 predicted protein [Histoplasma capsulatum G186AR]